MKCILRNIEKAGRVYADVVMMLLWTAARRGEVLGMKWSELDLDGGIWRIPAEEKSKNKRPHEVMLPSQAVRYLVSRFDESASEWVFPSPRWPDRPMRPDTLNHAIRKAIPEWKVEHFCPHDIRRTAATHLSGMFKCPRRVLEVILNHVDGSVTGRYDRHHYREEAASSLQAWADRLEAMRAVNER